MRKKKINMESLEPIIRSAYQPESVRYSMSKLDRKCIDNFNSDYNYENIIEPMIMLLHKDIKRK